MKRHFNPKKLASYFIASLLFSLGACCYPCADYESDYTAITMTREELKTSIVMSDTREVSQVGKIYIKDDFIFVNEVNKGFHIYDNSTPSAPLKVKFLEIPGATDVAIRGTNMYINQATDLVTLQFNIVDYTVNETGREIKVFTPKDRDPEGDYHVSEEGKIIVDYEKK